MIYLSSSSGITNTDVTDVFTVLGENSKKIKIEDKQGNEKYVEIEYWNGSGEEAWLHTNIETLPTSGTTLTLYYDNDQVDNETYIGETGSAPASEVWVNSNLQFVCHFNTPLSASVIESKYGRNLTANSLSDSAFKDSKIGKGVDFPGQSGDWLRTGIHSELQINGNVTVEMVVRRDGDENHNQYFMMCGAGGESKVTNYLYSLTLDPSERLRIFWEYDSGVNVEDSSNLVLSTGTYYYIAMRRNVSSNTVTYNRDGSTDSNSYSRDPNKDSSGNLQRVYVGNSDGGGGYYDGLVDELRISNTERSNAWVDATRLSLDDNLITYSAPVSGSWS
jgi:hypothetical protein